MAYLAALEVKFKYKDPILPLVLLGTKHHPVASE